MKNRVDNRSCIFKYWHLHGHLHLHHRIHFSNLVQVIWHHMEAYKCQNHAEPSDNACRRKQTTSVTQRAKGSLQIIYDIVTWRTQLSFAFRSACKGPTLSFLPSVTHPSWIVVRFARRGKSQLILARTASAGWNYHFCMKRRWLINHWLPSYWCKKLVREWKSHSVTGCEMCRLHFTWADYLFMVRLQFTWQTTFYMGRLLVYGQTTLHMGRLHFTLADYNLPGRLHFTQQTCCLYRQTTFYMAKLHFIRADYSLHGQTFYLGCIERL